MLFNKNHVATLEHTNISVKNPDKTAQLLCQLFNWQIRWSGDSMDDGYTVHVGSKHSYLALYTNPNVQQNSSHDHTNLNNLNHIGIEVGDLDVYKNKAIQLGLTPNSFKDYKYCNSFYVVEEGGLELEIVCYRTADNDSNSHYDLASRFK